MEKFINHKKTNRITFSKNKKLYSRIFHDLSKSINVFPRKIISFIFYFFVLNIILIDFIYSEKTQFRKLNENYNIVVNISGIGEQQILNPNFQPSPTIIYFKGDPITPIPDDYIISGLEEEMNSFSIYFDVQKLDFERMFENITSLIEVDFQKMYITSSSSGSMAYMFKNCISLASIKTFDKIGKYIITNMTGMFSNCESLTSVDLSGFINTENILYMDNLFQGCKNLKYIDFGNFNVENVISMDNMFSGCTNLEYINFKNFKESTRIDYTNIFQDVPENLVYCIDDNTNINKILEKLNSDCILMECGNLAKHKKILVNGENYCLNNCFSTEFSNNKNYLYKQENMCYISCPEGSSHLATVNGEKICLINNCPPGLYFEKNGKCVSICSTLEFLEGQCIMNNQNVQAIQDISDTIINEFVNSTITKLDNELIQKYDNETFQLTNIEWENNNKYVNGKTTIDLGACEHRLKQFHGINRDDLLIIFKEEFYIEDTLTPIIEFKIFYFVDSTRTVEIDMSNCDNNDNEYSVEIPVEINESEIYKYDHLSDYYNITDEKELNKRKKEYNKKYSTICEKNCELIDYNNVTKKVECVCKKKTSMSSASQIRNSNKNDLYFFFDDIVEEDDENTEQNSMHNEIFPNLMNLFKSIFNNPLKNISDIEYLISQILSEGTTELVKESEDKDMKFSIIPEEDQDKYEDLASIELGSCGDILKSQCGLSENDSLIIAKFELFNEGYLIPKIEYQVYNPKTNEKLSLDECEGSKIDISIPVKINENELFKYNSSSDYYSDFCFPYTTNKGTDIIINDRQNEYADNNMKLCEDNCEYTDYN